MKAAGWLALTATLLVTGLAFSCAKQTSEPRIDTSNYQAYIDRLQQVRSQLNTEQLSQFDRVVEYVQYRFHLQKQFSLLPTEHPLDGLTAQEVLMLPIETRQRHSILRLHSWMRI